MVIVVVSESINRDGGRQQQQATREPVSVVAWIGHAWFDRSISQSTNERTEERSVLPTGWAPHACRQAGRQHNKKRRACMHANESGVVGAAACNRNRSCSCCDSFWLSSSVVATLIGTSNSFRIVVGCLSLLFKRKYNNL